MGGIRNFESIVNMTVDMLEWNMGVGNEGVVKCC